MMKKATKYGILIFAAVLVVAMAFAGAASAGTKEVSTANDLKDYFGVHHYEKRVPVYYATVDGNTVVLQYDVSFNRHKESLTIKSTSNLILDLNGHTISYAPLQISGHQFATVDTGASFTITDRKNNGAISGFWKGDCGGAAILVKGTFTLESGNIRDCNAILNKNGGAVYVDSGTFIMNGGSITGCSAIVNGGGVSVASGTFTMNGGSITGCSATLGGGVYVADGAKFILNYGKISGCSASTVGDLVYVYGDGVFEMNNGHLTNSAETSSDAVHLLGSIFNMTGGTIDTCVDEGVYVEGGRFNMTGGTITGCGTQGVHVDSSLLSEKIYGSFVMNGGNITNCKNSGVVVEKATEFTMNGGNITDCQTLTYGGGGVYVSSSSFTMNGGNITRCKALQPLTAHGGGVLIKTGRFVMNGGSIADCRAITSGGGVFVNDDTVFTMTGGSITNCSAIVRGGGVFVDRAEFSTGTFNVTGTATVKNNTVGSISDNVYIERLPLTKKMAVLNLIGPFSGDIGIANPAGEPGVQFGTADAYYEGAANFSSDDGRYLGYLMKNSDTYLLVWADKYAISVDTVDHGMLTANRTEAAANTSVQVVAAADPGYHLNATCWYNASDADNRTYFEDSFKLPGNHGMPVHYVNVSGDFQPNVTVITLDQNGGHGGTMAVNATYGESTFNTSIANPQRTGHIFVGWNLSDSGDELIDVNGTLVSDLSGYTTDGNWTYTGSHGGEVGVIANWSAIIYNVTVIDDGYGTASANISSGSIGTPFLLTVDSVTEGYEFKEWYILDGGVIIDENNVSQIYDRDVIIKALFQKTGSAPVATGSITVNIVWPTDGPLTSAYIQLMPSTKYAELPAPSGSYTHTFTEVEPGVYSVDITYVYADTNATVRKANVLADNTAGPDYTASVSVTLPGLCANTEIIKDENTSIREIKADGLVEEAEYWASNLSGNVTVTLTLTEDAMSGSQYQFIQDIRQMMPSVNVSGLQPINATVWLSSDDGIRGLSETETVFELYVPFDGQGKYDIRVFRSHNGTTTELQRLDARPDQGTWTDGTYFIGPQGIYIYTDKFSFYAIGYSSTAPAVYTPSSSHQTGYTVILPDSVNTTQEPTQNPTPVATRVPTQVPTTQPTQKSPAPVIGLIAGLGIAAVLLRLRR